jgi:ABC-type oligopeptide transport system ATPase subunit
MLGGAPAVWNTCLMYFQALLLLGYLYAHASVRYLSTRIAVMYHGKLVEIGDTEQITARPAHPYTRTLLGATPVIQ